MTMTHLPNNICPLANKASREFAVAGWKRIPESLQRHDVNVVSMDHFDPEHRVIGIFEAESMKTSGFCDGNWPHDMERAKIEPAHPGL